MTDTWIQEFMAALDTLRTDDILPHFDEQACFRIGSSLPIVGRPAIRDAMAQLFASMRVVRHACVQVWVTPDSAVLEASVTCARSDGATVAVPSVGILRVQEGQIVDYRWIMDPAPLS